MSNIIVIRNDEHQQTENWIPINETIINLCEELSDDYLTVADHISKIKKLKQLINKLYSNFQFPGDYSWNTQKKDGIDYLVIYVDDKPRPREKLRTGHIYFGSYMEGAEDAGNCKTCDGAKCDFCKEVYRDCDGELHRWEEPYQEESV